MRFIVNGAEYEAASLERITGIDALALPKQAGMGVQTLAKRLEEMSELGAGVMDSEPHLRALLAFLWLSRRISGERGLTFEEACDFPIASLEIVTDDTDDEVADDEPDPTSSPAGAPVGGKPGA